MTGAAQTDLEDWLETFEMTRTEYLEKARATARLLLGSRDEITINDVREHCPPHPEWDGRVLGAVFRHEDFEATGRIVKSNRKTCHGRPIQLFRRAT
jgi:hypothetical protein